MEPVGFRVFETALGACAIAWNERGIVGAQLPEADAQGTARRMQRRFPAATPCEPPAWVARVIERIRAVLAGGGDDLADVPLALDDVPAFHRHVYELTRAIRPGRTRTYGEIARELGGPGAARAVGQALGHNPFAPIVPCHRVLGAGNSGVGFSASGGVATKLRMLEIEQAQLGDQPGLF